MDPAAPQVVLRRLNELHSDASAPVSSMNGKPEPVELSGQFVAIRPLSEEHAVGLLAAADAVEVFAWLPYPRPADLRMARAWIADALADRDADRRLPFAVLDASDRNVIGSTSYWDFDAHNAHVI